MLRYGKRNTLFSDNTVTITMRNRRARNSWTGSAACPQSAREIRMCFMDALQITLTLLHSTGNERRERWRGETSWKGGNGDGNGWEGKRDSGWIGKPEEWNRAEWAGEQVYEMEVRGRSCVKWESQMLIRRECDIRSRERVNHTLYLDCSQLTGDQLQKAEPAMRVAIIQRSQMVVSYCCPHSKQWSACIKPWLWLHWTSHSARTVEAKSRKLKIHLCGVLERYVRPSQRHTCQIKISTWSWSLVVLTELVYFGLVVHTRITRNFGQALASLP